VVVAVVVEVVAATATRTTTTTTATIRAQESSCGVAYAPKTLGADFTPGLVSIDLCSYTSILELRTVFYRFSFKKEY
jgi:hypothetical protein